jgi:hypothetical protein
VLAIRKKLSNQLLPIFILHLCHNTEDGHLEQAQWNKNKNKDHGNPENFRNFTF